MSSYSTTHEGLERVLEGTRALSHSVGPTRSLRAVPLIVLTGIVTAVVALTSRQFADAMPDGFTGEWLATWAVGAFAALVFARTSARIAYAIVHAAHRFSGRLAQSHAEREFLAAARRDPRMISDLRAAQSRAERE
ncbi:MAG: hypothetical protein KAY46_04210 [Burkholderiaceae bacterium]|jgi:hypothetical protein|nr:hypothetical protein [Burkholderiaceae bacterium]